MLLLHLKCGAGSVPCEACKVPVCRQRTQGEVLGGGVQVYLRVPNTVQHRALVDWIGIT